MRFTGSLSNDDFIQKVKLTGYTGHVIHDNYHGAVWGDYSGDIFYSASPTQYRNAKTLIVEPSDKNNTTTMDEIDVTGHRKSLLEGLRKQNLRFTRDWKPVTLK